jgi:hypothetical protein
MMRPILWYLHLSIFPSNTPSSSSHLPRIVRAKRRSSTIWRTSGPKHNTKQPSHNWKPWPTRYPIPPPLIANNTDDPIQLTALRTTIPSIVSPLTRPATTKPAAFAGLKKAAVGAVTGVQDLRREWESDGVQDLLKRSKTSYEKNTGLGLAAEVPAWGWVEEGDKQEKGQGQQSEVVKEEKVGG